MNQLIDLLIDQSIDQITNSQTTFVIALVFVVMAAAGAFAQMNIVNRL